MEIADEKHLALATVSGDVDFVDGTRASDRQVEGLRVAER